MSTWTSSSQPLRSLRHEQHHLLSTCLTWFMKPKCRCLSTCTLSFSFMRDSSILNRRSTAWGSQKPTTSCQTSNEKLNAHVSWNDLSLSFLTASSIPNKRSAPQHLDTLKSCVIWAARNPMHMRRFAPPSSLVQRARKMRTENNWIGAQLPTLRGNTEGVAYLYSCIC